MISPEIQSEVLAHVAREGAREACGLLVSVRGEWRYVPCPNIAASGDEFLLDPRAHVDAEALGQVVAVVHSHPGGTTEPSGADRAMCDEWGVPWFIVGAGGELRELRPEGYHPPLVGRVFEHGRLDCFSLIRDYFLEDLGITLPDFPRADGWWAAGGNLYLDHFGEAGFVDVTGQDLRPHDVPLMQLGAEVPNHAGVLLGDGRLLHHAPKRLSRRESYSGLWSRITRRVVRHRTLC